MRLLISSILFFLTSSCFGQINISWKLQNQNISFFPDSTFTDWNDFEINLQKTQNNAFEQGYLTFSIDSLVPKDSNNFTGFIHLGKQYFWKKIELQSKEYDIPNYVKGKWRKQLVSGLDIAKRLNNIVEYFSNNGYPFAKVNLDHITVDENLLSANINLEPGKYIEWDTLTIVGNVRLERSFLSSYLGIKKNKPFSEKLFKDITRRLKELPFIEMTANPQISFSDKKALVTLSLKQKSANFINGIVGVLPNSTSTLTNDESQLVITGDLKLNLGNSFGYGEKIKINWKRIQAESQRLSTKEDIPYLLGSFVGVTHSLDLLKQDSSFINFNNRLGIKYELSGKQSFTAFWENESTNALSNEALGDNALTAISGAKNSSGFQLFLDWLDYRFNPRKGLVINLEGKAGLKKINGSKSGDKIIIPLNTTGEITTALYAPETSTIFEGKSIIESYLPIWKSIVLKLANQSGFKFNEFLTDNDLFRLGGFQLLRGFDQQSVFATNYTIFISELRVLFEQNSFLSIFWDQSILQKVTLLENEPLTTTAIGAGINFQTKPGIFSISYALGKFSNNPFEIARAKIHFGFINLF
ncbi:MAG: hypothetical protein CMP61_02545 [Flavobacteriales bacterium]|nr:hypothetical protein [Flavobacteriales bacterium]|tara:strand:- start:706 stop:2457 length:1752 start_codon:yes stop_codon:yes gene_type:complete